MCHECLTNRPSIMLTDQSWIVDGFPRTLHQGRLLDAVLNEEGRPLNLIVHLNVPDAIIMARIAGELVCIIVIFCKAHHTARWVHLSSGRVYNTTYSAPKIAGKDDVTGEPLSKRPDDTPVSFTHALLKTTISSYRRPFPSGSTHTMSRQHPC
jgi:adenylate kinase family enzyme